MQRHHSLPGLEEFLWLIRGEKNMAVLVKTKLDLSDPDTLRELAFLTGNADYSFVTENLLNRIAEDNKAEEFGEYFRTELGKPDSTFRDCFDKEKFFNTNSSSEVNQTGSGP